jgi:hypothetical protein
LVTETVGERVPGAAEAFAERWVADICQVCELGKMYVEAGDMDAFRALVVESTLAFVALTESEAAQLKSAPPPDPTG